uniref:Uncharacterized protein n=1 Tax=Glossina austeni TaxID=7395 RepID=A0A1A9V7H4_GLOAU
MHVNTRRCEAASAPTSGDSQQNNSNNATNVVTTPVAGCYYKSQCRIRLQGRDGREEPNVYKRHQNDKDRNEDPNKRYKNDKDRIEDPNKRYKNDKDSNEDPNKRYRNYKDRNEEPNVSGERRRHLNVDVRPPNNET